MPEYRQTPLCGQGPGVARCRDCQALSALSKWLSRTPGPVVSRLLGFRGLWAPLLRCLCRKPHPPLPPPLDKVLQVLRDGGCSGRQFWRPCEGWARWSCQPCVRAQAAPLSSLRMVASSVFHAQLVLGVCSAPIGLAPAPGGGLPPGRLTGSVAPSHRLCGLGMWAFAARFSQRAVFVPRRKSSVFTACGKASLLPGMWASRVADTTGGHRAGCRPPPGSRVSGARAVCSASSVPTPTVGLGPPVSTPAAWLLPPGMCAVQGVSGLQAFRLNGCSAVFQVPRLSY